MCVLPRAVPEPLVDALASKTRGGMCWSARPEVVDILRQCLNCLAGVKAAAAAVTLKPQNRCACPTLSSKTRAARHTLAGAQTRRSRRRRSARVRAFTEAGGVGPPRRGLRGALAPPPTAEPLPAARARAGASPYCDASRGVGDWKAAKEHVRAALDQDDSGYDLRDGTHVERHVGSPR